MSYWSMEHASAGARGLGEASFLAAVALHLLLQEVGLRLRREEHRAWWAGTGRDLLNAAGFAALSGALWLYGFPVAASLLGGGTLTLFLFGLYVFFATQTSMAHPRRWALALGLLGALPVLVWPAEVLAGFGALAAALFPPAGP